jgi:hypothetical protein
MPTNSEQDCPYQAQYQDDHSQCPYCVDITIHNFPLLSDDPGYVPEPEEERSPPRRGSNPLRRFTTAIPSSSSQSPRLSSEATPTQLPPVYTSTGEQLDPVSAARYQRLQQDYINYSNQVDEQVLVSPSVYNQLRNIAPPQTNLQDDNDGVDHIQVNIDESDSASTVAGRVRTAIELQNSGITTANDTRRLLDYPVLEAAAPIRQSFIIPLVQPIN